jgi:uncharacterized membrane protein
MTLLVAGVILWSIAHLFKRLAPDARARMGDAGKGIVAVALLISVVLMVLGYRAAELVPVYSPVPGIGHLSVTLMLVAVYLYGVGGTKGTLYTRMRHPMLWGTVIWAVAHLLVNGDAASIVLFGGIGLWALVAMAAINRSAAWVVPADGQGLKGDLKNIVGTAAIFSLIVWVHGWLLGYGWKGLFQGTYG